jgi:hypothetical protein
MLKNINMLQIVPNECVIVVSFLKGTLHVKIVHYICQTMHYLKVLNEGIFFPHPITTLFCNMKIFKPL